MEIKLAENQFRMSLFYSVLFWVTLSKLLPMITALYTSVVLKCKIQPQNHRARMQVRELLLNLPELITQKLKTSKGVVMCGYPSE